MVQTYRHFPNEYLYVREHDERNLTDQLLLSSAQVSWDEKANTKKLHVETFCFQRMKSCLACAKKEIKKHMTGHEAAFSSDTKNLRWRRSSPCRYLMPRCTGTERQCPPLCVLASPAFCPLTKRVAVCSFGAPSLIM